MSRQLIFWVLMLLWLVFGLFQNWPSAGSKPFPLGGHLVLWIILAVLGWQVFGSAVHG